MWKLNPLDSDDSGFSDSPTSRQVELRMQLDLLLGGITDLDFDQFQQPNLRAKLSKKDTPFFFI